ncbi:hypothetical protein [Flammeovirga sp. SJP92]|uniref:hypothetical protein n=1 Tax=Flammeovirga sp. SJP92 TaxID=1775430 RepID=UPI0007881BCF|nr:hypothetical protein [Flammeovirga sp. SJP92]KXX71166.1 hypothetical protein AVL50_10055 [Flammeovirga sp. SJP92]
MRRQKMILLVLLLGMSFRAYTQEVEAIMPFNNMIYLGDRPIPLQSKRVDFGLRVWFNIGTSIDRIITLTKTTTSNQTEIYCYIQEIGTVHKRKKSKQIYNRYEAKPNSGYDTFLSTIDSLNLFDYKSQDTFEHVLDHNPFSVYMIEVKDKDRYNFFEFNTYWPYKEYAIEKQYEELIELIVSEFEINFRFPEK